MKARYQDLPPPVDMQDGVRARNMLARTCMCKEKVPACRNASITTGTQRHVSSHDGLDLGKPRGARPVVNCRAEAPGRPVQGAPAGYSGTMTRGCI